MEAPDDPTWTPSGKRAPTHRRLPCQKKIKTRYAYRTSRASDANTRAGCPRIVPSHCTSCVTQRAATASSTDGPIPTGGTARSTARAA